MDEIRFNDVSFVKYVSRKPYISYGCCSNRSPRIITWFFPSDNSKFYVTISIWFLRTWFHLHNGYKLTWRRTPTLGYLPLFSPLSCRDLGVQEKLGKGRFRYRGWVVQMLEQKAITAPNSHLQPHGLALMRLAVNGTVVLTCSLLGKWKSLMEIKPTVEHELTHVMLHNLHFGNIYVKFGQLRRRKNIRYNLSYRGVPTSLIFFPVQDMNAYWRNRGIAPVTGTLGSRGRWI
jgi:hypothetical protein